MGEGPVKHIESVEQFDTLVKDNKYVLVDWFADWCPPCKAISPLFIKLAEANHVDGKLAFVKIDVDEVPELGERYDITAMPTFSIFVAGEVAALPVEGVQGGPQSGAKVSERGVEQIIGADPRALVAVANELGRLAKAEGADAKAEPAEDTKTVSGSYTAEKRSDWKTSLRG